VRNWRLRAANKSFVDMAYDLIGPWAGYYIGWTYWLGWVLVGIAAIIM
jgi:D-serine/D-alanine/glycine transporter